MGETPLQLALIHWRFLYPRMSMLSISCSTRILSLAIEGRFALDFRIDYIPKVSVDRIRSPVIYIGLSILYLVIKLSHLRTSLSLN